MTAHRKALLKAPATAPDTGEIGELLLTRKHPGNVLCVERADLHVLLNRVFLKSIEAGREHPAISLGDDVLFILAENRIVSYQLHPLEPGAEFAAADRIELS